MSFLSNIMQSAGENPQVLQDTSRSSEAVYDTLWGVADAPARAPEGIEQVMLAEDKLYVVLAVVLIIWFGLIFFLLRTDRHLNKLEEEVARTIPEDREPV